MSTFVNYDDTSNYYDDRRQPLGADTIVDSIRRYSKKAVSDIRMLDSGCGTGNYSKALLERGIYKLTLTDASAGMLNRAKAKLSRAVEAGNIEEIKQSKLPGIPFKDSTFDVIMFSLVLHHLDTGKGTFTQLETVIQNAYRVLESEGLLIVIAQVESDLLNNWYYQINKNITNRYSQKFAPEDVYMKFFRQAGFKLLQTTKIRGKILADHDRLDGPLDQSWRACDSYWSVATDDDIKDVERKIADMQANKSLGRWVQENDRTVTDGCLTLFVCKK